jgi:hypothetical protein
MQIGNNIGDRRIIFVAALPGIRRLLNYDISKESSQQPDGHEISHQSEDDVWGAFHRFGIRITRISTASGRPELSSVAFELYKRPFGTYDRAGWTGL